jgi:hypothetical protein
MKKTFASVLALSAVLAACGGGGGNPGDCTGSAQVCLDGGNPNIGGAVTSTTSTTSTTGTTTNTTTPTGTTTGTTTGATTGTTTGGSTTPTGSTIN